MAQLVADGMHWKHTDFVKNAAQLVIQCRRVLAWSYARAFYIADKNAKTLFEFRQSELEQYTEKLVRRKKTRGHAHAHAHVHVHGSSAMTSGRESQGQLRMQRATDSKHEERRCRIG